MASEIMSLPGTPGYIQMRRVNASPRWGHTTLPFEHDSKYQEGLGTAPPRNLNDKYASDLTVRCDHMIHYKLNRQVVCGLANACKDITRLERVWSPGVTSEEPIRKFDRNAMIRNHALRWYASKLDRKFAWPMPRGMTQHKNTCGLVDAKPRGCPVLTNHTMACFSIISLICFLFISTFSVQYKRVCISPGEGQGNRPTFSRIP
jgi:hypothetical protein